jgi:hypothetical protein
MAQPQEPVAAAVPPVKMELQSIEDFEAEMDAMDTVREAAVKATLPVNPYHLPKKPKRTVDTDALEAEKLAREELGSVDWISILNGKWHDQVFTLAYIIQTTEWQIQSRRQGRSQPGYQGLNTRRFF